MPEKTTAVQIVLPQHCNGYAKPRLFGGQIMAYDEQMECHLFTMQDDISILNEFGGDQS